MGLVSLVDRQVLGMADQVLVIPDQVLVIPDQGKAMRGQTNLVGQAVVLGQMALGHQQRT